MTARKKVFVDGIEIDPCQFVMPPSTSNVTPQFPFELHLDAADFKDALASIYEKHRNQARIDDAFDPTDRDTLTEAGYPDFDNLPEHEDVMCLVFEDHLYSEFAEAYTDITDFVLYRYYLKTITGYRKAGSTHIFSGMCQDMGDRLIDTADEYTRQQILERALDQDISEATKSVLRNIITHNQNTIVLIGLLLDEDTDLNIARFMLEAKDPGADPDPETSHPILQRVYKRLENIDVDAVWGRLCEKWGPSEANDWTTPDIPPVEDSVLSAVWKLTDDDGNFYTYE